MAFQQGGSGEPPPEREGELRRRLAFYENFDEIINENVRRSGELLREAERHHAEAAGVLSGAREQQRAILASLAAEAATLHRQAGALSGRIEAALRALDAPSLAESAVPATPQPRGEPERVTDIVIHGVDDVAAAAALRDAVAATPGTERVEVMEFSGGLLRLRVAPGTLRPLDLINAAAAAAGASIETVASGPGVVAVRLSKESF